MVAPSDLPIARLKTYAIPTTPTAGSTDKSRLAPLKTKKSRNSGGVKRSHCSRSAGESLLTLIIVAPIIMQTSRLLKSSMVLKPTARNTMRIVIVSLLPREWKKRRQKTITVPMRTPIASEPTISISGFTSSVITLNAAPLSSVRAIAIMMA